MAASDVLYRFDDFEVDARVGEIRRRGRRVRIQDKPFQFLLVLLERPQELVTRDDLRRELWPDIQFLEFDDNLNTAAAKLRRALGDSASTPRYVETLPRRGYRFLARVERTTLSGDGRAGCAAPASRSKAMWALRSVSVALALLLSALALRSSTGHAPRSQRRVMLAVLPFVNMSGDPDQEYFSDGLTEEMITQLGGLDPKHLGVIARTSAMHFKGSDTSVEDIARQLSVDYLVEGSVRREGDHVRVSAQLIRALDQTHLWAKDFDRERSDILALQDDVARAIAREIDLQITPAAAAPHLPPRRVDPKANDLTMRGRYYWKERTRDGFIRARALFEHALEEDPLSSAAYSGLADAYTLMAWYGVLPPRDAAPRALAASRRALELDAFSGEAHASFGLATYYFDWDWQTGKRELERAIELSPGYATARYWHAVYLANMGRQEEATREAREAYRLDPLSSRKRTDVGWTLYFGGRYDEAIDQLRQALVIDPDYPLAHHMLGEVCACAGQYDEALSEMRIAAALNPLGFHNRCTIAWTLARSGDRESAMAMLRTLEARAAPQGSLHLAAVYGALGERDAAFKWLDRAFELRHIHLLQLPANPLFDPVRDDPRFSDLLRRMGLPVAPHA